MLLGVSDVGGAVNFGYQDRIGACSDSLFYVVVAPRGVQSVDADNDFTLAEATIFDGGADLGAGEVLGFGGDGVFKVEDQGVGGLGRGLFKRAGV